MLSELLLGFRILYNFTGGSKFVGYGSTLKCIKIKNIKAETLFLIGFRNYREKYIKTEH